MRAGLAQERFRTITYTFKYVPVSNSERDGKHTTKTIAFWDHHDIHILNLYTYV